MMFEATRPLEGPSHASWLHELRNVVSTASVAASVSRRLVEDDAASAVELLREAEEALARCRELLADGAEHVRDDGMPVQAMTMVPVAGERRREDDDGTGRFDG